MQEQLDHPDHEFAETLDTMLSSALLVGYMIEGDAICIRIEDSLNNNESAGTYHLQRPGQCARLQMMRTRLRGDDSPFDEQLFSQSRGDLYLIASDLDKSRVLHEKFTPLEGLGAAVDAMNLRFQLNPHAACSIIYLRCGDNNPFSDTDAQTLERLLPAIQKDTRYSYHRSQRDPDRPETVGPAFGPAKPIDIKQLSDRLSKTESVVLEHLLSPQTERDIAASMNRSPNTIHVHVKSIYRKLAITSRRELKELLM